MKKLISCFLILAFTLPLMAQEVEVKEKDGKTEVTIKKQHDKRDWNRGDMNKRNKRMDMAKRKKMVKKRAIRSAVRIIVVGGIAYYIGYHQGQHEKHYKGPMKRRPGMGDKK